MATCFVLIFDFWDYENIEAYKNLSIFLKSDTFSRGKTMYHFPSEWKSRYVCNCQICYKSFREKSNFRVITVWFFGIPISLLFFSNFNYTGMMDLNRNLVWYSNGAKHFVHQMVRDSSHVLNCKLIVRSSSGKKFSNWILFGYQTFYPGS